MPRRAVKVRPLETRQLLAAAHVGLGRDGLALFTALPARHLTPARKAWDTVRNSSWPRPKKKPN
jgi:hypothetical protein